MNKQISTLMKIFFSVELMFRFGYLGGDRFLVSVSQTPDLVGSAKSGKRFMSLPGPSASQVSSCHLPGPRLGRKSFLACFFFQQVLSTGSDHISGTITRHVLVAR